MPYGNNYIWGRSQAKTQAVRLKTEMAYFSLDNYRLFPYKLPPIRVRCLPLRYNAGFTERRRLQSAGRGVAMTSPREVMNVREASEYLGISPDTLYRYVYEDRIPAFKLGNRWKFKKTILDRWIERKISRGGNRRRKAIKV